jgi:hypothetical protein
VSAGGVTYTFTSGGSDGSGGFLVNLVIDTSGATASGVLNSFSVQFTGASDVTLASFPSGTGNWVVEGLGPNNPGGCNINGSADHWCVDGGSITVTSGGPGAQYTFVFDVKVGSEPTQSGIMAFQGKAILPFRQRPELVGSDIKSGAGVAASPWVGCSWDDASSAP